MAAAIPGPAGHDGPADRLELASMSAGAAVPDRSMASARGTSTGGENDEVGCACRHDAGTGRPAFLALGLLGRRRRVARDESAQSACPDCRRSMA
jgi:hypothetical protein